MIVLGIESSCDETAVAIVNDKKEILSSVVLTQSEHKSYGGVVPEIAARAHLEHIDEILEQTFKKANIQPSEIDRMYYFEYEMLIDEVKEYVKEQNKQKQKEDKNMPNYGSMMSQQRAMMNNYKTSMPSMPSLRISFPKRI